MIQLLCRAVAERDHMRVQLELAPHGCSCAAISTAAAVGPAKQTQAQLNLFENPIPRKMRFVFTSCLVPFSIAIMGHRSDSELFIYVAATMS